ncbi:DNA kinase/phosphatase Pnk1 [Microbotryomycetes sp. JL221]|nr:DNA kinase/phosphatase Pnk1 [Microbotryomycetes sp. JL221]
MQMSLSHAKRSLSPRTSAIASPAKQARAASSSHVTRHAAEGNNNNLIFGQYLTWLPPIGRAHTCIVAQMQGFKASSKVALFDCVPTVVKLEAGASVAADTHEFREGAIDKMRQLHEQGFCLILCAFYVCHHSQERMNQQRAFLEAVGGELVTGGVAFRVYTATKRDEWFKPSPALWYEIEQSILEDGIVSFYCGSAAGRIYKDRMHAPKPDHSDSDRCFALNIGVRFTTPEELIDGHDDEHAWSLKQWNPALWRQHQPFFQPTNTPLAYMPSSHEFEKARLDVIVAIGPPASGKTFLYERYLQPAGYVRITSTNLSHGSPLKSVISAHLPRIYIDTTLPTIESRQDLVGRIRSTTQGYSIRAYLFTASWQVVKHNAAYRALSVHLDNVDNVKQKKQKESLSKNPASCLATPHQTQLSQQQQAQQKMSMDASSITPVSTFSEWYNSYQAPKVEKEGFDELKRINFVFQEPKEGDGDDLQSESNVPRGLCLWLKFLDVYGRTLMDQQEPGSEALSC